MDVISEKEEGGEVWWCWCRRRRRRRRKRDRCRGIRRAGTVGAYSRFEEIKSEGRERGDYRVMISLSAISSSGGGSSSERPDGVKRHNSLHFEES